MPVNVKTDYFPEPQGALLSYQLEPVVIEEIQRIFAGPNEWQLFTSNHFGIQAACAAAARGRA
jgi:hypothetical protein